MNRNLLVIGSGALSITIGIGFLVRFWVLSGTETPPGRSGGETTTILDWASFFVSPLLILGGIGAVVFGLVRSRATQTPST